MDLIQIYQPIKSQLKAVEKKLKQHLKEKNPFLSQISAYVFNSGGKRLRPALVLLSAQVGAKAQAQAIVLAAVLELIHTATLVQDDVIDRASVRRGQRSLRKLFGGSISILYGDYLYSKAFTLLSGLADLRYLDILVKATNAMVAGEIEQLRLRNQRISERQYLKIIEMKTAGLMAACCQVGGLAGRASVKQVRALTSFGLNFGLAFQIIDDTLDGEEHLNAPRQKARTYMDKAYQALETACKPKQWSSLLSLGEFILHQV